MGKIKFWLKEMIKDVLRIGVINIKGFICIVII